MEEPERLSMSTGLPSQEKIKKIPLPSITKDNGFWQFVAEHEKSREKWLRQKDNEDHKEGD